MYKPWTREITVDGKQEMEEEYFAAHAGERTIREWSTLLTRSIGAISKKTSRMGITCKNNNTVNESQPEPLENRMVMGVDPEKVISYLRQKPRTATELADVLDRGPQTVMEIVAQMQKLGYCVVAKQQRIMTSPPGPIQQAPIVTLQDQPYDEIAFLLISDLHYSNQHAQVTAVHRIVDLAIKEYGINFAFIAGDICDGINMYKGQANEQYAIGADAQVWAAINHLPRREGFRYFLLSGNHDGSFYKAAGLDICRLVGAARHDVDYLGAFAVDVPITEALSIRLWHPSGGCPYALCLSDDSEILTERGWVGYQEICMSDKVATLNPNTHALEYQTPTGLFIDDYEGPMVHIQSRTVDHMVTPEHDLYVRQYPLYSPGHGDDWHKKKARDIVNEYKRQKWQMTTVIDSWEGEEPETFTVPKDKAIIGSSWNKRDLGELKIEPWLAFLGWYISEGHTTDKAVAVTQNKGPHLDQIVAAMKAIGHVKVYKHHGESKTRRAIMHSVQLVRWLNEHAGKGAANKRVPRFVMGLSPRLISIFLDALFDGDGWHDASGTKIGYKSISPQLLDDVQELLLKVGVAATVGDDSLSVCNVQNMPTITNKPEVVPYSGKIWCVTMPNGLIYARRNGRAVWTGNSYRGQKAVASMGAQELIELMASTDRWYDQLDALGESLERGDVVSSFKETVGRSMSRRILGIGHLHVMTHFATGGIHVFQAGCFEGQTSYLKQKQLTPEIGGWIIRVQFTRSGQIKRLMAEWIPFEERFDDHRAYPLPPMPGEANALEPIFSYEDDPNASA